MTRKFIRIGLLTAFAVLLVLCYLFSNMNNALTKGEKSKEQIKQAIIELDKWNISYIPPILHYIYKDEFPPIQYKSLIEKCVRLNADMKIYLWTDADAELFLKNHYAEFASLFSKYTRSLQKSDAIRYFLLYHFGGVYMDMDVSCEKPLISNLKRMNITCILDKQRTEITRIFYDLNYYAMNSVMACRKNHPFFKFVFERLSRNINGDAIHTTGPAFLTAVLEEWWKNSQIKVQLADPEVFSPNLPASEMHSFAYWCNGYTRLPVTSWRRLGCEEMHKSNWTDNSLQSVNKRTLTRHLYYNLGYSSHLHKITQRFNFTANFPQAKRYTNNFL